MKKIAGLFIFFLGCLTGIEAQDCTTYFPSSEGAEVEMQYFNAKDKLVSISTYTVKEVEKQADAVRIKTHMKVEPQGKGESFEDDFEFYCKGNTFYFDMKQYMKDMQMDQFEDMEVTFDSEDLALPANLNPGDELEDASISISLSSGGMKIMSMNVQITDRKVEGMESVTTPAGTFDCARVSYTVLTKSMFSMTTKAIAWYTKGIGTVKTEDYDKKGKLAGYSLLTRIKQ